MTNTIKKNIAKALLQLHSRYASAEAYIEFGNTADGSEERKRSYRRALDQKATGIIEHDRILNNRT